MHLHLFVYGTLMRGGANHAVLERLGARFVALATTSHARTLVDLGPYPALLPHSSVLPEPTSRVAGELWSIPERAFDELDAFEGCPDLFSRAVIDVEIGGVEGETPRISAQVYVLAHEPPLDACVITPRCEGHPARYTQAGQELPHGANADQIMRKNRGK